LTTLVSDTTRPHERAAVEQRPRVIPDRGGPAKVLLWDELKMMPDVPPGANGAVSLGTGRGGRK
jgi:hypothetical protein